MKSQSWQWDSLVKWLNLINRYLFADHNKIMALSSEDCKALWIKLKQVYDCEVLPAQKRSQNWIERHDNNLEDIFNQIGLDEVIKSERFKSKYREGNNERT